MQQELKPTLRIIEAFKNQIIDSLKSFTVVSEPIGHKHS